MKRMYIKPSMDRQEMMEQEGILNSSTNGPETIYDDYTADGDESLSRNSHSIWDDEE